MGKRKIFFYLLSILPFILSGCKPAVPTVQPTLIEQTSIPTLIPPTYTLNPTSIPSKTPTPLVIPEQQRSPTPTITITPISTLDPEKANELIKTLLREPVDCAAPCFWGIVPGKTTVGEARDIFNHLGLQMASWSYEGKDFSGVHYVLDSGLSILVTLTLQNNIVENMQIQITDEKQDTGMSRDWLAYSPETLIKRYGTPSRVDFIADWGPGPFFAMQMYFNSMDLIVQYFGDNIIPRQKGRSQVCLLTAQFEGPWIWMGQDPIYPPGQGIPLEEVTSLTLDEFATLMLGDPNRACFTFDGNAFE